MNEICLYIKKPSKYFKVIYISLFLLLLAIIGGDLLFFQGNHIHYIVVASVLFLANYYATVSQKYSFFIRDEFFIVRNEYLFYKYEKLEIHLDKINEIDFRFAHSPKLPSIHVKIKANNQQRIFHIDDRKENLENFLNVLNLRGINLTFSNIQTHEDKRFVQRFGKLDKWIKSCTQILIFILVLTSCHTKNESNDKKSVILNKEFYKRQDTVDSKIQKKFKAYELRGRKIKFKKVKDKN